MTEALGSIAGFRPEIEELWRRQWFVGTSAQLRRRGMSSQAISRAVRSRRLHLVVRGVYSPIPPKLLTVEGRIAAALLLGGRGSALFAESAAWHLKLVTEVPLILHIAAPASRRPAAGISWHYPALRAGDLIKRGAFWTTSPQRTALDMAIETPLRAMQRLLAELEYHYDIEATDLEAITRQGHPGSANLRVAIASHIPALAYSQSHLEEALIHFLDERDFVTPGINCRKGAATVDAVYEDPPIAIELDGIKGHRGERRILRDHRRDLHRRADGYLPLRYHYAQLIHDGDLVAADLERAGVPKRAR